MRAETLTKDQIVEKLKEHFCRQCTYCSVRKEEHCRAKYAAIAADAKYCMEKEHARNS